MTRINTNVASLRGLRSLNKANNVLGTALQRLSTGLKINNGKDNPSGLIASEVLRLQVTTIEQSIKNSNRANNVIATADGALHEISGLLNQIRGLVQEGLNTGALSQAEIEANQLQIDNALSAVNRIAANTTFAGEKLIDGSKAFVTQVSATDAAKLADYQINETLFGSNSTIPIEATVTSAAEKGALLYSGGGLTGDTTLEVAGSRGSQVLFFSGDSTLDHVADAINTVSDATGVMAEITTAAVAGTVTMDSTAANADILLTDARTTTGTGVFDQTVQIEFVNPGANSSPLDVSVATDASGNKTVSVSLATDATGVITSTAAQVIAAINADTEASTLVTASNATGNDGTGIVNAIAAQTLADGTDGEMSLTSVDYGSAEFVDINVLKGTFATTLADGSTAASRDEGVDIGVTINGIAAQGKGLQASVKTAMLDASLTFQDGSNAVGESATVNITGGGSVFQIGEQATTAGQIGVGLDAINTARLGGVSGKLYELGTGGGKSLLDIGPNVQGIDLVSIIDEALDKVNSLRGRLGSLQKNVIETNIQTLSVALENISEARSEIVDADFAVETANMTKGQVLTQAGMSVLAIANQNPAQVLSLFR